MQSHQHLAGPAPRRFVQPYGPVPAPVWYLGLDLGKRQDHSALVIFHLLWTPLDRCADTGDYLFTPPLTVRSIERFPLNTSYEDLPRIIAMRANQIGERHRTAHPHTAASIQLIIDAGGPGGPMVDRLRRIAPGNLAIKPVIITAGSAETQLPGGFSGIPRRALVTRLVQLVARGSLFCPAALPNVSAWMSELLGLSASGTRRNKSRGHDDLTMAAALAAWAAVKDAHELAPGTAPQCKNGPSSTFGLVDKRLF